MNENQDQNLGNSEGAGAVVGGDGIENTVPHDGTVNDSPTASEGADLGNGAVSENEDQSVSSTDDTVDESVVPEGSEEAAQTEIPVTEPMIRFANYRITGVTDVFDKDNNAIRPLAIGKVYTLPVEYGNDLVDHGKAELTEELATESEIEVKPNEGVEDTQ